MKKTVKFLVKLIISLVFVFWLIRKIDWGQVLVYTQHISLWQIALYITVLLIGMMISAYKWKILSDHHGFRASVIELFQWYLAGTFLNNFFPSFIGGDTYRAYQLGKGEKKFSPAAATVVMDRVTGLIGAMLLSIVFAIFNWRVVASHHVLVVILAIVVASLVGVAILSVATHFSFWKHFVKFVPKKVLEVIKDFAQYQGSSALPQSILFACLYSLVGLGLVNYVLFWALGIHVGVLNYLTVIFLISIVSSIPVSVNNIGIKEWAYVTFFGFFGVTPAAVVTVALVSRVLQMVVSFAALPQYLKNKK